MDLAAVDRLLTTTRSVRRRLDLTRPVEPEVLERCIEIALQAPTGSNVQGWRFIVVTDPAKRAAIADIYRKARVAYRGAQEKMPPGSVLEQLRSAQPSRVGSAFSLDDHLQEVPVHVVPCVDRRAYVP
ncbi:MAG: nitroreductase family protein, partial [Chloroflexi bacterium]|nr:nitroreductase family protein [Chloroflexota bacterium]